MAKMTLLDIVTDILNDLDSDNVNGIFDTIESEQVANIVKSTYYEMIARRDYPHLHRLVHLESSLDPNMPTHMQLREEIQDMGIIRYDRRKEDLDKKQYEPIERIRPEEFLTRTNRRNSLEDNIIVVEDFTGIDLLIKTDKQPDYYTTFDDEWIIFDSIYTFMDTTLQSSKIQAFAVVEPEWVMSDDFIPDLPSQHFPSFVAEAKGIAFSYIKQMPSQKAEQQSQRGQRWLSRKGRKVQQGINYPDLGRGTKKGYAGTRSKNPHFGKDR